MFNMLKLGVKQYFLPNHERLLGFSLKGVSKSLIALIVAIAIAVAIGATYYVINIRKVSGELTIFCAGSLKIPLDKVADVVKKSYGTVVHIVPSGSVEAVRKVTDLGLRPDIVAVADYRLIPKMLVPKYTNWYLVFASNQIVITFTSKSKYADYMLKHPDKWYEVLARKDVKFGFSDPNKDPCGYRAVGVIALSSIYYYNSSILKSLILDKTNIKVKEVNGKLEVYVPAVLKVKASDLIIRPKSVDLIALLESGALDYAFEYKSVAIQHGLKYVELPKKINLSDPSLKDWYAKVVIHLLVGNSKEVAMPLAPIAYGITILSNAKHYDAAVNFIKVLLGSDGREIFKECGQPILTKPLAYGNVPEVLRSYVEVAG